MNVEWFMKQPLVRMNMVINARSKVMNLIGDELLELISQMSDEDYLPDDEPTLTPFIPGSDVETKFLQYLESMVEFYEAIEDLIESGEITGSVTDQMCDIWTQCLIDVRDSIAEMLEAYKPPIKYDDDDVLRRRNASEALIKSMGDYKMKARPIENSAVSNLIERAKTNN